MGSSFRFAAPSDFPFDKKRFEQGEASIPAAVPIFDGKREPCVRFRMCFLLNRFLAIYIIIQCSKGVPFGATCRTSLALFFTDPLSNNRSHNQLLSRRLARLMLPLFVPKGQNKFARRNDHGFSREMESVNRP